MIQEKASQYFANSPGLKILFLFDSEEEFLDEVKQIDSKEFQVVYWENNPFVLKYILTHELQHEKVLLYLPIPQPTSQEMYHDFPLMGLLLANKELQLDNVGEFMEEFGLKRHQKRMVSSYISELKYANVQAVVKPVLLSGEFQESVLQQALLSAFLKYKNRENWVVLIAKLCILSQEKNQATFAKVQQKIKANQLEDLITNKVKENTGYSLKAITAEEFIQTTRSLLYNYTTQYLRLEGNDPYAQLKITDSVQLTAMNQFWQVVESNRLVSKGFQELLRVLGKDIKGSQLVATYGMEANFGFYTNELIWGIINELQQSMFAKEEVGLRVLENLALQQEIQGAAKETLILMGEI